MSTEFVGVPATWTVDQVKRHISEVGEAKETVYAIYVLPVAQGKGHARALIRERARELKARRMTSLLIWVLRENAIGRGFYEPMGGWPVRDKPLEDVSGAEEHIEVGYGWMDTAQLG